MASDVLANLAIFINAETTQFQRKMSKTEKTMDGFSKKMNGIGVALAGLFAADQLAQFGKAVIKTTAEFEKLKAVLTTSLGSKGAAEIAFQQIQEFASSTPFQVQTLTDSFVKLSNQGFKPTIAEMRKMGDLASSTGKDFNQLTEALIDAQVGEFERLKEFGIRAQKSGDQVKFTFKGVETQVKFTDTAIRDYIVGLGATESVSGSMAAISNTLGGKLSNLQDSFDSLFYTLGQATDGVLPDIIDGFITLTNAVNEAFKSTQDQAKFFISTESIDAAKKRLLQLRVTLQELKDTYEKESQGPSFFGLERSVSKGDIEEIAEAIQQQFFALQQLTKDENAAADAAKKRLEVSKEANKVAEVEKGILGRLSEQLKEITKLRDTANTEAEIKIHNDRIDRIDREIKKLKELGSIKDPFEIKSRGVMPLGEEGGVMPVIQAPTIQAPKIEGLDRFEQDAERLRIIEAAITNTLANTAFAFGEGLGKMAAGFGSGMDALKMAGQALMDTLSQIMADFGRKLIAIGVGETLAGIPTGPAKIAGGVALMALAGASKGASRGMGASSGGVGSGGSGESGNRNRIPTSRTEVTRDPIKVQGEWVVRGDDLRLVLKNNDRKMGRVS